MLVERVIVCFCLIAFCCFESFHFIFPKCFSWFLRRYCSVGEFFSGVRCECSDQRRATTQNRSTQHRHVRVDSHGLSRQWCHHYPLRLHIGFTARYETWSFKNIAATENLNCKFSIWETQNTTKQKPHNQPTNQLTTHSPHIPPCLHNKIPSSSHRSLPHRATVRTRVRIRGPRVVFTSWIRSRSSWTLCVPVWWVNPRFSTICHSCPHSPRRIMREMIVPGSWVC